MTQSSPLLHVLIGSLQIGGTEKHLAHILPELKKRGWNIELSVFSPNGPLEEVFAQHHIPVHTLITPKEAATYARMGIWGRAFRLYFVFTRLCQLLLKKKQMLHCFLPEASIIGIMAAVCTQMKGPLIVSRRSLNTYQKRRPLIGKLERYLLPKAHILLGNSQRVVDQLREEGFVHTALLYNGISLPCVKNKNIRQTLHIPEDAIVLVQVANMHPYKGYADLLKTVAKIHAPLFLLCVGREEEYGNTYKNLARCLGIEDRVLFLGQRSDVADILYASDICVLFSEEEGFSHAVLEGMAMQLPVIARDVGGNGEAIIHQKTGFIFSDLSEAKTYIQMLIDNPDLRRHMGQEGYDRVKSVFSLSACVDAYETLYKNMLKE